MELEDAGEVGGDAFRRIQGLMSEVLIRSPSNIKSAADISFKKQDSPAYNATPSILSTTFDSP